MNILKRLSYRRELRSLTSLLGLSGILRKWYYRWARPRDGILRLRAGRIDAALYIHTPEELRFLESTGISERHLLDLLVETVKPGDVVYDIGANVGFYTVPLAKAVGPQGKVIAFEPERTSYNHLQENLKLNGVTNVRSYCKALGDRNGEAKLYLGKVGNLSLLPPDTEGMSHEVVELVAGDGFRDAESLPLPRAVKIDVEGYEYAVLEGLRETLAQPLCDSVFCEIHPTMLPAEVNPGMVLALLESLGFTRIEKYPGWNVFHVAALKRDPATRQVMTETSGFFILD